MLRNYFKTAWRSLKKSKGYSTINIAGLAIGMAVAMLIGFWIWDEISFNKTFDNYKQLGQLYQNRTFNGRTGTYTIMAQPMSKEIRTNHPEFKDAALTTTNDDHILAYGEKKITSPGMYVEPQFTKMFSLKMKSGKQDGLKEPNSILISESLSKTLFDKEDALGKIIKADNKGSLTVAGVFKDFPRNTEFAEVTTLMSWAYLASIDRGIRESETSWSNNNYNCYVQASDNVDINSIGPKIKGLINSKVGKDEQESKPEVLLLPMSKWRLHSDFADGKNIGGFISIVRLFAIAGIFVLLLACINFMNLSTARSEKRAKEVGIRKAIGSIRTQLIKQFLSESFLFAILAFLLSLVVVNFSLAWFNMVLSKDMTIPWSSPVFWLINIAFIIVTALLAGSYPAFYLSSFKPVKVLKGTFKGGRLAALPRRVLVVVQFTVSVTLIIGTIIVYRQIKYAKDRPLGYNANSLIYVANNTPELNKLNSDVLRNELLATNVVENMSASSTPMTIEGSLSANFTWEGSGPTADMLFSVMSVTQDHGKTVGLEFVAGRDFQRNFKSDSAAIILNETAAKMVGDNIIGKTIVRGGLLKYTIIGVVKDMVRSSPYSQNIPAMFLLRDQFHNTFNIKIKPTVGTATALTAIESVFKKFNPAAPFDYQFADELVARKFDNENLISKLATFFAILAIFISCLGIFGLASFIAEQRTREIGVRKVLGASVFNVWNLLSKDFVFLVMISFIIAAPIAWYLMNDWLQNYEYRTEISWWVFGVTCIATVAITLLTVSFQAIKAAIANPVKSLRTE